MSREKLELEDFQSWVVSLTIDEFVKAVTFPYYYDNNSFSASDFQQCEHQFELLKQMVDLQVPLPTPIHPRAVPNKSLRKSGGASNGKSIEDERKRSRYLNPRLFQLIPQIDGISEDLSFLSADPQLMQILNQQNNNNNNKKLKTGKRNTRNQEQKYDVIAKKFLSPWGENLTVGCTAEQRLADEFIVNRTTIMYNNGSSEKNVKNNRIDSNKTDRSPFTCSISVPPSSSLKMKDLLRLFFVATRGKFMSKKLSDDDLSLLRDSIKQVKTNNNKKDSVSSVRRQQQKNNISSFSILFAPWFDITKWFSLSSYIVNCFEIALWRHFLISRCNKLKENCPVASLHPIEISLQSVSQDSRALVDKSLFQAIQLACIDVLRQPEINQGQPKMYLLEDSILWNIFQTIGDKFVAGDNFYGSLLSCFCRWYCMEKQKQCQNVQNSDSTSNQINDVFNWIRRNIILVPITEIGTSYDKFRLMIQKHLSRILTEAIQQEHLQNLMQDISMEEKTKPKTTKKKKKSKSKKKAKAQAKIIADQKKVVSTEKVEKANLDSSKLTPVERNVEMKDHNTVKLETISYDVSEEENDQKFLLVQKAHGKKKKAVKTCKIKGYAPSKNRQTRKTQQTPVNIKPPPKVIQQPQPEPQSKSKSPRTWSNHNNTKRNKESSQVPVPSSYKAVITGDVVEDCDGSTNENMNSSETNIPKSNDELELEHDFYRRSAEAYKPKNIETNHQDSIYNESLTYEPLTPGRYEIEQQQYDEYQSLQQHYLSSHGGSVPPSLFDYFHHNNYPPSYFDVTLKASGAFDGWLGVKKLQQRETSLFAEFFTAPSVHNGHEDEKFIASSTAASIASSSGDEEDEEQDLEVEVDIADVDPDDGENKLGYEGLIESAHEAKEKGLITDRFESNLDFPQNEPLETQSVNSFTSSLSDSQHHLSSPFPDTNSGSKEVSDDFFQREDEPEPKCKVHEDSSPNSSPSSPPTPPPQLSPLQVSLADLPELRKRATSLDLRRVLGGNSDDLCRSPGTSSLQIEPPPLALMGGSLPSSPIQSSSPTLKKNLPSSWSRDDLRIAILTERPKPHKKHLDKLSLSQHQKLNTKVSGNQTTGSTNSSNRKLRRRTSSNFGVPKSTSGKKYNFLTKHSVSDNSYHHHRFMPSLDNAHFKRGSAFSDCALQMTPSQETAVYPASSCKSEYSEKETMSNKKKSAQAPSVEKDGGNSTITSDMMRDEDYNDVNILREERDAYRDMCLTLGAEIANLRNRLSLERGMRSNIYPHNNGASSGIMYSSPLTTVVPQTHHSIGQNYSNNMMNKTASSSYDPEHIPPFFFQAPPSRRTICALSDVGVLRHEHDHYSVRSEEEKGISGMRRSSSTGTATLVGSDCDRSILTTDGQQEQQQQQQNYSYANSSSAGAGFRSCASNSNVCLQRDPIFSNSVHAIHSRLSKDISNFLRNTMKQLKKQEGARHLALKRLSRVVNAHWPRAQTKLYGSHKTNLCLPSSDLDFVICLPAVHKNAPAVAPGVLEGRNAINETWQKLLARNLKGEFWLDPRSMKLIERTVVPVIKVSTKDAKSRVLQLDISFDGPDHHGLEAVDMVTEVMTEFPMVRPLVLVLKQFLLDRGLLTAYTGGLSSYCLFLMVTRFLQEQQSSSSLFMRRSDCGSLLIGFLDFYGNWFDPRVMGISVSRRQYFSRQNYDYAVSVQKNQEEMWSNIQHQQQHRHQNQQRSNKNHHQQQKQQHSKQKGHQNHGKNAKNSDDSKNSPSKQNNNTETGSGTGTTKPPRRSNIVSTGSNNITDLSSPQHSTRHNSHHRNQSSSSNLPIHHQESQNDSFVYSGRTFTFDPFFVEDPLSISNNVGRNAFRIHQIQRAFSDAHRALVASLEWDVSSDEFNGDDDYPLLKCLLQSEDVFHEIDDSRF